MGRAWDGQGIVAAESLLRRWQDMGPTVWLVAGAIALVWALLYAMAWAVTDPRRVKPGARTLDLPGAEPPAVVALLTHDWVLGHEALPATLLDLAARGYLAIDSLGEDTLVRVRDEARAEARGDRMSDYERMVFEHVGVLARRTHDGVVHAQALTTGPGEESERWWKNFRKAVVGDAQARGLSRPRFPPAVKVLLTVAAVVVAIAVAVATTTIRDTDPTDDDDPAGLFVFTGIGSFSTLVGMLAFMRGERDTPAGREAAAAWLGVGDLLSENPLFAEHPPAGVAIWDRHLGYGAALGVAHGAVAALPLGAESETEAWSSVGGRWRVVRVRYPRFIPPGYGKHPGWVTVWGAVQAFAGLRLFPMALSLGEAAVDLGRENGVWGTTGFDGQPTEPPQALVVTLQAISAGLGVFLILFGTFGAWLLVLGLADLVSGRRPVQGVVIRRKLVAHKSENSTTYHTYVAVDDGTKDRVAAWRFKGNIAAPRHAVVRGRVTRYFHHVKGYEVPSGVDPTSIGHAATPQ